MNSSPSSQDPSASSASPAPAPAPDPSAPAPDSSAPPHHHHVHLTRRQFVNYVISGVITLQTSVILYYLPYMLGFTLYGITKGSIAAWLMSLGGGVTPYIVSVLQSVGAAGFGIGGIFSVLAFGGIAGVLTFLILRSNYCVCCKCCKDCTKIDGDCCQNCTCICHTMNPNDPHNHDDHDDHDNHDDHNDHDDHDDHDGPQPSLLA